MFSPQGGGADELFLIGRDDFISLKPTVDEVLKKRFARVSLFKKINGNFVDNLNAHGDGAALFNELSGDFVFAPVLNDKGVKPDVRVNKYLTVGCGLHRGLGA